ncbi:MAG: S8 family serine peptidase, partial [candidate division Zixibacteria bacterium]|nr:S8 family serine peptidase [candidate division Zixibacteria bacterium]
MVRIRILLRAAACVLGFAIVLSAESATDTDRSLYVKFSEPIIEVPKGEESGGRELIKLKDHNLGKLLLSFNIESIKYAYPLEFRIDSIVHNRYGIPVRRPNFDGIFRITLPDNEARAACLAALDGQDDVLLAEPCISSQTTAMQPNDTCFWKQWGLHNDGSLGGVEDADIDAPEAWDLETGSSNTIIAIIDVGVRTDHEDLAPRAYGDWQTSDHGTHVAGTAAATGNNIAGGAGVNWHAMILDKYHDTTDAGTIAPQIINAVDEGAQILNNSYQTNGNLGSVAAAAAYAVQMDCAFIAGKGNNGSPNAYYPADYYYVFSVGATNSSDRWVSFSNYGNGINVAAPGYNIYGPIATTQTAYAYKHGTSIAGPFVSGIASLLHAHRGDLSSSDMLNLIMSSADDLDESPASPGYDDYTGWGRVNARQALDLLHPPYSLIHYSVSGGSIHQTLENLWLTFMANPYVADGVYIGDRVEIRHNVTFDHEYLEPPLVWGRLAATVGYSALQGFTSCH